MAQPTTYQHTRQQMFLPPQMTCTQGGVQKQFIYATGVNPRGRVQNYAFDTQNHRTHAFQEGFYPDTPKCCAGSSGIDGTCVCPASANSMPFQDDPVIARVDKSFFSPTAPVRNDLTPEARYLIAQRRPLPLGNKQPNFDGWYAAAT